MRRDGALQGEVVELAVGSSRARPISPSDLMAPMVAVTAAAARAHVPATLTSAAAGRRQRREQLRGRHHAADGHHAAAEDLARQQHVRGNACEVSAPPGAEPPMPDWISSRIITAPTSVFGRCGLTAF